MFSFFQIFFRPLFLSLALAFLFLPFFSLKDGRGSLEAEIISSSGYSGFLCRMQTGLAYNELIEDYGQEDKKYYSHGPHLGFQIGWANSKNYAIHLNLSAFLAMTAFGPDRQERTDPIVTERTKHSYLLGDVGIGFTWFSISSAVYISPVVNFIQLGTRGEEQRVNDPALGDGQYSLFKVDTRYSNRVGYGVIIGNDRWFGKNVGMGLSLSIYQNHLLMEKQTIQVSTEPAGTVTSRLETDLQRVSARNLLFAISANFTYN